MTDILIETKQFLAINVVVDMAVLKALKETFCIYLYTLQQRRYFNHALFYLRKPKYIHRLSCMFFFYLPIRILIYSFACNDLFFCLCLQLIAYTSFVIYVAIKNLANCLYILGYISFYVWSLKICSCIFLFIDSNNFMLSFPLVF